MKHAFISPLIAVGAWTFSVAALAATPSSETSRFLAFSDPNEACALVAAPGDFILQKIAVPEISEDQDGSEKASVRTSTEMFGRGTSVLVRIKELLSLNDPFQMTYGHAELITQVSSLKNIVSWSFYPPSFQRRHEKEARDRGEEYEQLPNFRRYSFSSLAYRTNYTVYRMKALSAASTLNLREKALARGGFTEAQDPPDQSAVLDQRYGDGGVCSDFVNWAHGNHATSWWNFLPGVRKGIATVFPPEAITTPDDLAESPYTRKVCEIGQKVIRGDHHSPELTLPELLYPGAICTKDLVTRLEPALRSQNPRIATHAQDIESFLIREQILSPNHDILVKKIYFLPPLPESERVKAEAECLACRRDQELRSRSLSRGSAGASVPMSTSCQNSCQEAKTLRCD